MERGLPMSQMTKRALEASLKELLRHKPLDKITVSDLTDHCGVNRMTFYYHFKDIYDLVEWCCEEDAARALAGQKTYDTWQQGFLQILEALRKDKAFFTSVYRSISREQLENYLYRLTYDLMMGVVEERAAGMTVRPEDKEFIANFYKFAFVGLTLDWIKNDMRQDPAQLVEQLSTLIHGDVTKALEKSRRDKNLITAAVLLIVSPSSAGYTIDIPKGTPQINKPTQGGFLCIIPVVTMKLLPVPKNRRALTTRVPTLSAAAWPRCPPHALWCVTAR